MILKSKLLRPQSMPNVVITHAVREKLENWQEKKILLMSAPAGFGKTVLTSALTEVIPANFCWVVLDPEDNVHPRFFAHLIKSYAGLFSEVQVDLDKMDLDKLYGQLQAELSGNTNIKSLMGSLLNILLDHTSVSSINSGSPEETVLVLDNFQYLNQASILEGINFFFDYLPQHYHVWILSRNMPDVHVMKRKLSNELIEISAKDLSFTVEETGIFVNKSLGYALSFTETQRLQGATDGWPAALQWVVRGLSSGKEVCTLDIDAWHIKGLSDYLVVEVFAHLESTIQEFLMGTAFLPKFSAEMADSILASINSRELIASLRRESLFIISIDENELWYRYQDVFKQALQKIQLGDCVQGKGMVVQDIIKKAIDWFVEDQQYAEALQLCLSRTNEPCTLRLLENYGLQIIYQGNLVLVKQALAELGLAFIKRSPRLVILQIRVWLATTVAHIKPVEEYLEIANSIYTQESDSYAWHQECSYIQCHLARLKGDVTTATEIVTLQSDFGIKTMSVQSMISLAMSFYMKGDLKQATVYVNKALSSAYEESNIDMVETCSIRLAWVLQWQGLYAQAKAIYQQSRDWLYVKKRLTHDFIAWQNLVLSAIHREFNELSLARQCMDAILENQYSDSKLSLFGPFSNAKLLMCEGRYEEAELVLNQVEALYLSMGDSIQGFPSISAERVKIALHKKDYAFANHWLEDRESFLFEHASYRYEEERLTLARVHICLNVTPDKIEPMLHRMVDDSELGGRITNGVIAKLLLAITLYKKNKTKSALSMLDQVLSLAAAVGYVRIFLDEPAISIDLLKHMLKQNKHVELLRYLLQRLDPGLEDGSSSGLVEPLSRRELDVLALLGQGYANKIISEQLFIGVGTVKTHVRNILSKLTAANRTQAVSEARKRGII